MSSADKTFLKPFLSSEFNHQKNPRLNNPLVFSGDRPRYAASRMRLLPKVSSKSINNLTATAAVRTAATGSFAGSSHCVLTRATSKMRDTNKYAAIANEGLIAFTCSRCESKLRPSAASRFKTVDAMESRVLK